jgi:flagellar motor switch protein FliM
MRSADSEPPTHAFSNDSENLWNQQRPDAWIEPHQRQALLVAHQQLAAEWSELMRDYLRPGDQFTFSGFDFESLASVSERSVGTRSSFSFSCNGTPVAGAIIVNEQLALYLVEKQLGGDGSGSHKGNLLGATNAALKNTDQSFAPSPVPLTHVENALLRKIIGLLIDKLGGVYGTAGLSTPKAVGSAEGFESALGVTSDEHVCVFHYRIGGVSSLLELEIVAAAQVVTLVRNTPGMQRPVDDVVSPAISETLLNLKLVLGSWRTTIEELSSLRNGDELVLPDGTDALLVAGPVVIRRVHVTLCEGRIIIETKDAADGAG